MRRRDPDSLESRRKKIMEEMETLDHLKRETEFERGDFFALIIAALTTIFPLVLIILLLYYVISMAIFN